MTMRNRKTVIVAFLIVAVMLMAVGFAALTDNLIIAGEANSNTTAAQTQWEKDIFFSAAKVLNGDNETQNLGTGTSGVKDEASVGASNNDHANYKVNSLARKGEKAVFVFTITNVGTTGYDAKITVDTGYPTNTNGNYYSVTYSYGDFAPGEDIIVPANGTLDVTVTVELIKDPDVNLNAQFTLNLTATSVEPTP